MTGSELRHALHNGQRVYGTCITSTSPHMVPALAGLGLDFVFIDTEHVPVPRHTLAWMCRTYRAMGMAPVVRVPSPDPYEATMALDAGACGLIAPYVETVEQVRALAGAVKWRPLRGQRLDAILAGDDQPEPALAEYIARANEQHVLIVNIESQPAIDALEAIVRVPELDAVLIGPHDLSTNLGIPEQYRHPTFDQAVRRIIRTAREANVGAGIHYWLGLDQEIDWSRHGANLIVHGGDILLFRQIMQRDLAELREALGDAAPESTDDDVVV